MPFDRRKPLVMAMSVNAATSSDVESNKKQFTLGPAAKPALKPTPRQISHPVSYPTKAFEFLQKLEQASPLKAEHGPRKAAVVLKIHIVGAGLGGLATAIALRRRGHIVTIFEAAPQLGEVGAGIQIPPNSTRLLLSWGLGPLLEQHAVEPAGMRFRRWENGEVIGFTKLVPDFRESFNAPYYVIHRAHFHDAMHKRAVELGVHVKVNSKVVDYDLEAPSLKLENGSVHTADLIVAADGVKSVARKHVVGVDMPPLTKGFVAFRATVDAKKMESDPDISWLLENPGQNIWIGEGRHIMTYTISGNKSFNMVMMCTDYTDPSTWKQEDAVSDMKREFQGWDPRLGKIFEFIEKTIKWPVFVGQSLPHWVSPSNKVLILGDAAHAMVPYMSQGAAMAVEDGAALAEVLSLIESRSQIPSALKSFQTERIERTSQMQEASLANGVLWHYPDGPEQRARDLSMRPEVEGRPFLHSANQWSDPITAWWSYGYDAEKKMREVWQASNSTSRVRDSRL